MAELLPCRVGLRVAQEGLLGSPPTLNLSTCVPRSFPLGVSLSFVAWGVVEFRGAYASTGQLDAVLDTLRWGAEYLIACHTAPVSAAAPSCLKAELTGRPWPCLAKGATFMLHSRHLLTLCLPAPTPSPDRASSSGRSATPRCVRLLDLGCLGPQDYPYLWVPFPVTQTHQPSPLDPRSPLPIPLPTHQVDHDYWGRPEEEDLDAPRRHYTWNATPPASDRKSAAAAAHVAATHALSETDPDQAERCLAHPRVLYASAAASEGRYSQFRDHKKACAVYKSASHLVRSSGGVGGALEVSVCTAVGGDTCTAIDVGARLHRPPQNGIGASSDLRGKPPPHPRPLLLQDDLAYAAAWLYRATGEGDFLGAAQGYLQRAQGERNLYVSWDDVWTPADVLLLGAGAPEAEGVDSRSHVDEFLESWQEGALGVWVLERGCVLLGAGVGPAARSQS